MKTKFPIQLLFCLIAMLLVQNQKSRAYNLNSSANISFNLLELSDNQSPTVSITALNSSYNSGDTVQITINTNDSDGTITQHQVFVNNTLVDTDGSNYTPYVINNLQNGNYTIKVIVTDNDNATGEDVKSFTVGNSNNDDCNVFKETDGLVVIEAENLQISSSWTVKNNVSGFTGNGYIDWTGADFFNNQGSTIINTEIQINNPGTYKFQWRTKVGQGSSFTDFNDTWLKFPDASDFYGLKNNTKIFPIGSGKSPNPDGAGANGFFKVYLTGTTNWTWVTKTSDNDPHDIYVDFNSPGTYTMQISARSMHHLIDRITLSKANVNATDLSIDETTCDDTVIINDPEVSLSGELRKWHNIALTFTGPNTNETNTNNPFLNYRLDITFTSPSGKKYIVPGYYAADGNAANSNASSGNKWRAHLAPDEIGNWTWSASFRTGNNVAVNDNSNAGTATSFNGATGNFDVLASNKSGRDFRSKGRLEYVNEHYLRFAETGEYMIKQGPDSPENLFAYSDFDNTPNTGNRRKNFAAHVNDWNSGDPTWDGNKGRGLIGAVNYIASEGLNSMSFLTMNINGDDKNVFPYIADNQRTRIDVSKLAQWAIVIEHMQHNGIFAHFKTQETENETLLDNGNVGTQRKLYYRELIARFGYNLALNWNLGEENGGGPQSLDQSEAQERAMAEYFYNNDPYNHHIVIHKFPNVFPDYLLGDQSKLTGFSLQTNRSDFDNVFSRVKEGIDKSRNAGKKWAVACDEPGDAQYAIRQDNDRANSYTDGRKNGLWGALLAGAWGNEWYFGYQNDQSDLTLQDFRSRDAWWDYCRYAIQFFDIADLPLTEMLNNNGLSSASNDYCYAKQGEAYIVYLKNGGSTNLNLNGASGNFTVKWYDPRNGGNLQNGSVTSVTGGGNRSLGNAPNNSGSDWVILVQSSDGTIPQDGLDICNTNASSSQSPNLPDNTIDGNLNTRWSAFGNGETLTLDLCDDYNITDVKIAFFNGNTRQTFFDLQVSTDNNTWINVLNNAASNGNSIQLETFDITDTVARYVRYVGLGNSTNSWNSVTEIEINGTEINTSQTTTLSPIHDAYLQGSTRFNNTDLRVESGNRVSYLMFDLSNLSGSISNAELKLTVGTDTGNGAINVYLGNSNNWTENNISNSNKPSQGALLASKNTSYSLGTTYTWNLNGLNTGSLVSLLVVHNSGNDVSFWSKEGNIKPELVLTTNSNKQVAPLLNQIEDTDISLYPNPSKDYVSLTKLPSSANELVLYDISGNRVLSKKIKNNKQATIEINIKKLPVGIYILNILSSNTNIIQKRIIKK